MGRVVWEGAVFSKALGKDRFVRIYLPPSYDPLANDRFPVLYLHDGQNVFSTVGDYVAFGWGNWRLDKTVDDLVATKRMREIILVAVDCGSERYLEYRGPAYEAKRVSVAQLPGPRPKRPDNTRYQDYARFLIHELKPKIDREYRTLPSPENTGTLGSSMGGLCSLALAWQYPAVFGLAASLAGAFQVERRYFLSLLRSWKGKPKPIRIYLDSGVMDHSGGDDGEKDTAAVAQALRNIGWRDGVNLQHYLEVNPLTQAELIQLGVAPEKWKEAQISQHNELSWRLRAWRPLSFLFPPA
jgi:predicted alpha/beta superfamily hydrolase